MDALSLENRDPADTQVLGSGGQPKVLNGTHRVYGAWFEQGNGYRNDKTQGIATGNEEESMYMVTSGKRYNDLCCFDYGNSENSVYAQNKSDGAGAMEAIYFGSTHWQGNTGDNSTVNGPWVGADLEAGMYYGGGNMTKVNPNNKPLTHPFRAYQSYDQRIGRCWPA